MKKSDEIFWKKIELILPLQTQKGNGDSYKLYFSLYWAMV